MKNFFYLNFVFLFFCSCRTEWKCSTLPSQNNTQVVYKGAEIQPLNIKNNIRPLFPRFDSLSSGYKFTPIFPNKKTPIKNLYKQYKKAYDDTTHNKVSSGLIVGGSIITAIGGGIMVYALTLDSGDCIDTIITSFLYFCLGLGIAGLGLILLLVGLGMKLSKPNEKKKEPTLKKV